MRLQRHVLIVEDDSSIIQFLEMLLTDEGYRVSVAENGRTALEFLAEHLPDLILLDMWMPIMDGTTFFREYQQSLAPRVPIIAMSAANDVFEKAVANYMQDFLPKPFDIETLLECINKHLP